MMEKTGLHWVKECKEGKEVEVNVATFSRSFASKKMEKKKDVGICR